MNKRYIDFVPTQSAGRVATGRTSKSTSAAVTRDARRVVARERATGPRRPMGGRVSSTATGTAGIAKSVPAAKVISKEPSKKVAFAGEKEMALGVIENVGPKFVKTDVPKRPLSAGSHFAKTGLAATKAKKITGARGIVAAPQKRARKTEGAGAAKATAAKRKDVGTYTPPKTSFINQDKVQKRPLSKNVYRKKAAPVSKEEQKGPVTIIAKSEKDSHVGLVVTVILTIILGAAAGTVAFLLLPK